MLETSHLQITLSIASDLILQHLLTFPIACSLFHLIQGKFFNSIISASQVYQDCNVFNVSSPYVTGFPLALVSGMLTILLVHFMHLLLWIILQKLRDMACTRSSCGILIAFNLSPIIPAQMPLLARTLKVSKKAMTAVVNLDGTF